jgi:hypothetical protein
MDSNLPPKVYGFVLPLWITSFVLGSMVFTIVIILFNLQAERIFNSDTDIIERVGTPIALLLFSCYGIYFYLNPFYSKLLITVDGYEYRTMFATIKASWTESALINKRPILFGRFGILHPLTPVIKISKLGEYTGRVIPSREIPINYFGNLTSKLLTNDIRRHAPYLFGVLYTESDFVTTLDALDQLIERYRKAEIHPHMFYTRYNRFYGRYIISGKDFTADSFNMMMKYSEKIAYLTAVWDEIVKPYFPDYEEKRQNDEMQIRGINERYARDE